MDEELAKIQECNGAEIVLEPTNKKCLFLLGMLFVNGVKIKILNEESLDLTETTKSFSMMPYVWSRMANTYFPNKNHSNVHCEMDRRVVNLKRLGVTYNKIEDAPIDKKIFLICPVRNATNEQRKMFEDYVIEKQQEGFIVHAPHLHTVQTDFFGGYSICTQNAQAVASSSEVDIYYDQSSTGSVFDLGVAYALHKPLKVLNEQDIVFDEADMIDNIIKNWPYNEKELIHRLRNNQE